MTDWMSKELELVEKYLIQFTEDLSRREPLSEILRDVLDAKGKRLRPRMVLACGMLGPDFDAKRDRLCRIGALIEMVHCASLIHDDIIDDSSLRRGRKTIQARYGKDMAVYAGDYILGKVLFYLMEMGAVKSGMILGTCVQDMCAGELLQHHHRFDSQVTEEQYFAAIYGKTGALFRAACEIGALEGGGGRAVRRTAGELGEAMGMFFQLRDDLMDFQAGKQWDGKPTYQDFFQGIYTLPVICGFKNPVAGNKMRALAERAGQREGKGELPKERLGRLLLEADGIRYASDCMEIYRKKALKLMTQMPEGRGKEEWKRIMEKVWGQ